MYEKEDVGLITNDEVEKKSVCSPKLLSLIILSIILVSLVIALIASLIIIFLVKPQGYLPNSVQIQKVMNHLKAFEDIAFKHPKKSRSVVNAYNQSAEYVIQQLQQKTTCQITKQHFKVPVFDQLDLPKLSINSPYQYAFQHGVDFQQLRYGGSGNYNFTADLQYISAPGCDISDFSQSKDKIVLMELKTNPCDLIIQALNAEKSGAKAILFFNGITRTSLGFNRVRFVNWTETGESSQLIQFPAFSASYSIGKLLTTLSNVSLNLYSNSVVDVVPTFNIICDAGNPDKDVVVAGAHLDSVPEGPGLNDNGSGSAALLEIVIQYFQTKIKPNSAVRFCWWGAEEIGLLGARYYVRDLSINNPEGLKKIAAYMNFDMLGSPNYVSGVFQGDSSMNPIIREPSNKITDTFLTYFNSTSNPFSRAEMIAGSDFVPFVDASIPSGGLQTGASSLKNMDERTIFKGFANAAYDPCYHLSCDTIENINQKAIEIHAKAAAHVIQDLTTKDDVRKFLNQKSLKL